ncbi:MAG: hypothetical protein II840_01995 [Kiritimatiellae bacterium]|nr:hypothetical protein [Kiritimatiellia bacterium]
MKAEKVIGIAACAFACVTSSAFANTTNSWFGAVGSGNTITLTEATTNGVDVSVSDGVITLDGDTELTFAPTDGNPARSDNLVTIESSAVLTPNAAGDLPPSGELTDAQVGFAVAYEGDVTNYYCYANGAWGAGAGTPPANPTDRVTFKITLDYRTHKAKFEVGNVVVSNDVTFSGSQLSTVAARGSGSLTEVSAKYEIAVAEYGGTKYGSVAEAVAAAVAAAGAEHKGDVKPVDGSGNVPANATAANGLPAVVCSVLGIATDVEGAQVKAAPVDNDIDPDNITLAIPVSEPGIVKFTVNDGTTSKDYTEASAIKIPLKTGRYTITPALQ